MGRLIDADKLIESFRASMNNGRETFDIGLICEAIDYQLTAYDVDAVAEQLEEEKKRAFELCLATNDSAQRLKYLEKEQTIALAIEIVKGGGVDAD